MKEIIIGILSFLGGLVTCKIIAKLNIQWNKLFVFFNSGTISQNNKNLKDKK
ncbi:hypothetical protein [Malaciobacter marinus]|uniref:hypothetical protein n=1 Tax=Malaciobacter marinus TaxID=505249 RepID=UPI0009CA7124|nr:hypothetical protein [Malaciobacter marinus]SKB64853.1 hypothetical protein SAMN06295997_1272 [Malaciobacter marinus]